MFTQILLLWVISSIACYWVVKKRYYIPFFVNGTEYPKFFRDVPVSLLLGLLLTPVIYTLLAMARGFFNIK